MAKSRLCQQNHKPVVQHRHQTQIRNLVRFDARAIHAAHSSGMILLLLLLLLFLLVRSQPGACAGIACPTRISTLEHGLLAHPASLQRWC